MNFLGYQYNFTRPLSRRELLEFTLPSAKHEDHFLHRLAGVECYFLSFSVHMMGRITRSNLYFLDTNTLGHFLTFINHSYLF